MTVWVNGKKMQLAPNTEGYVQLDRSWSNGDKVEVELTPQVTVEYLKGSDKYAAFLYGPIVLAAKSTIMDWKKPIVSDSRKERLPL